MLTFSRPRIQLKSGSTFPICTRNQTASNPARAHGTFASCEERAFRLRLGAARVARVRAVDLRRGIPRSRRCGFCVLIRRRQQKSIAHRLLPQACATQNLQPRAASSSSLVRKLKMRSGNLPCKMPHGIPAQWAVLAAATCTAHFLQGSCAI